MKTRIRLLLLSLTLWALTASAMEISGGAPISADNSSLPPPPAVGSNFAPGLYVRGLNSPGGFLQYYSSDSASIGITFLTKSHSLPPIDPSPPNLLCFPALPFATNADGSLDCGTNFFLCPSLVQIIEEQQTMELIDNWLYQRGFHDKFWYEYISHPKTGLQSLDDNSEFIALVTIGNSSGLMLFLSTTHLNAPMEQEALLCFVNGGWHWTNSIPVIAGTPSPPLLIYANDRSSLFFNFHVGESP